MAIIKFSELKKIRAKHKNEKIIFATGVFDLLHPGHVLFFEDCKKFGDILVVGVGSDLGIKKSKGKERPILNQHLRMKAVDSLRAVDYCFLDTISEEAPFLHIVDLAFARLKPNFYMVNEDAQGVEVRKKISLKHEVKFIVQKRVCPPEFEKISSTKIIEKIKSLP